MHECRPQLLAHNSPWLRRALERAAKIIWLRAQAEICTGRWIEAYLPPTVLWQGVWCPSPIGSGYCILVWSASGVRTLIGGCSWGGSGSIHSDKITRDKQRKEENVEEVQKVLRFLAFQKFNWEKVECKFFFGSCVNAFSAIKLVANMRKLIKSNKINVLLWRFFVQIINSFYKHIDTRIWNPALRRPRYNRILWRSPWHPVAWEHWLNWVFICNIHKRLVYLFFSHSHQPIPKFLIHFWQHTLFLLEFVTIFLLK